MRLARSMCIFYASGAIVAMRCWPLEENHTTDIIPLTLSLFFSYQKCIAAIVGLHILVFANKPDIPSAGPVSRLSCAKEMTCIAAHPSEAVLASADSEGAITLWLVLPFNITYTHKYMCN